MEYPPGFNWQAMRAEALSPPSAGGKTVRTTATRLGDDMPCVQFDDQIVVPIETVQ